MKLLYDVTENRWYDAYGAGFASDNPQIPYGNSERVEIQLFSHVGETNLYGGEIVPSAGNGWIRYTGYASVDNVGAVLATDNNFLHWLKGNLNAAVSSVAENATVAVKTSASIVDISPAGTLFVYDGEYSVALAYKSRVESASGVVTFTMAAGNSLDGHTYPANANVDIPEALYAQAEMNAALSDKDTGKFVFDFVCFSEKLRNKMQYNSIAILDDCKGLELTVFTTNGNGGANVVDVINRFRCASFRITGGIADLQSGVPASAPQENAIKAILNAYVEGGMEIQCAAGATITEETEWLDYADIEDFQSLRWFRFRILNSGAEWCDPVPLIVGATGEAGQSVYPYIAYASDDQGTDFTLTWHDGTGDHALKYTAFLLSTVEIETPTVSDFSGLWVRFGGLDLLPYWEDEEQPSASVAWEDITSKPDEFPPESHTHEATDLPDKTRNTVASAANPQTLYLNKDIIENTTTLSSSTLSIDFTAVRDAGGHPYLLKEGDVFTWEYWVKASVDISTITTGSSMVTLPNFPSSLPRLGSSTTRHVFTIRGVYKAGASNNMKLLVNYAYSDNAV